MNGTSLAQLVRAHRTVSLLLFDGLALGFSYFVFALLRYDDSSFSSVAAEVFWVSVGAVAVQWFLGWVLRLYRGRNIVASLEETVELGIATTLGGVAVFIVNAVLEPQPISRAVPLGATFMALFGMLAGRALWRRHWDRMGLAPTQDAEPTLVFGAGSAGRQVVRSMLVTPEASFRPVGLLDDDRWKRRLRLDGVQVLGTRADIAAAAEATGATTLIIAIPGASSTLVREVSAAAVEASLDVKILPPVHELVSGRVSFKDARDIDVADLLGRDVSETDVAAIAGYLTGKRVLVTGAGGSIGSELCRQLHRWGPAEVIMLDRDESALHAVQLSLHGQAMLDSPEVVLADVRDVDALHRVFSERRPEVVFHAAALKHVTMLEQYPNEAMKTNVHGTLNVLRAAALAGVERFVNVSTDKAADPTSVLGYSKRVAERLTATVAADTQGSFLSVRFGNVLGSRGSVLTAFTAQIEAGGPVTVTHPDVSRYLMTVQEAVQLVIQAAAIGRDGDALILDMGEPVRIEDIARQLIEQSGQHIEIVYTGLREGEKLHEILLGADEEDVRPEHPLVTHARVPELNTSQVSSCPLTLSGEQMRQQMISWCRETNGRVLEPEPQIGPREWSSIEH